jgi:hypothetical protein
LTLVSDVVGTIDRLWYAVHGLRFLWLDCRLRHESRSAHLAERDDYFSPTANRSRLFPPAIITDRISNHQMGNQRGAAMSIILQSPAFKQNHLIPKKHTGDGDDVSPPLSWSEVPAGTKELALIVDDPDAPTPEPWVHWLLYKVPPATSSLAENVLPALHVSSPAGALQGANSWPKGIGYRGPAPPKGHGLHHYHFKLFALDASLELAPGVDKAALLAAMKGHIVAEGELIGTYQR